MDADAVCGPGGAVSHPQRRRVAIAISAAAAVFGALLVMSAGVSIAVHIAAAANTKPKFP